MAGVSIMAMQRMGFGGFSSFGGMTQPDGKFAVTGLTPGDYVIRANLQGTQDQAAQAVTIDGSDITDLQLMVTKLSTIRGRVVFEPGGTPPQASAIHVTAMRDRFDDQRRRQRLGEGRPDVRDAAHRWTRLRPLAADRPELAAQSRAAQRHRRHRHRRRRPGPTDR